jgi:DNA-binding NtrC family response regulator
MLLNENKRQLYPNHSAGGFREDLYYRLNTFPIRLPTLAERAADIPMLVETLLQRVAPRRRLHVAREAMARLVAYRYPGNVRELRNVLEWAALMCDGDTLEPPHLPDHVRASVADASPSATPPTLRELEAVTLRSIAAAHAGTRRDLAKSLGISERTLYRKLRDS